MQLLNDIVSTFTRMRPYSFKGETVPCNLCGSTEHDIVGRRDRYGNKLLTVLCKNCGLVFTNPMPTEEEVAVFYRKVYRRLYHGDSRPRKKAVMRGARGAVHRHEFIKRVLKDGDRVLDVGAGGGEFVNYMCGKGYDAHGIEPNEGFVRYAVEKYGVPIRMALWQTAEIDEGSFDLITANHVVEHFLDPLAALRCFRSWLKPGGKLFVSVPDIYNPNRTPYSRFHFGHLYNFTYPTLVMMARRAGLTRSKTTPETGTTLIFDVADPTDDWFMHPDSYAVMRKFFDTYTNRRYFLSITPYYRWFLRMNRLGGDMVKVAFARNPGK